MTNRWYRVDACPHCGTDTAKTPALTIVARRDGRRWIPSQSTLKSVNPELAALLTRNTEIQ